MQPARSTLQVCFRPEVVLKTYFGLVGRLDGLENLKEKRLTRSAYNFMIHVSHGVSVRGVLLYSAFITPGRYGPWNHVKDQEHEVKISLQQTKNASGNGSLRAVKWDSVCSTFL